MKRYSKFPFIIVCLNLFLFSSIIFANAQGPKQTIEVKTIVDDQKVQGQKPEISSGVFTIGFRWIPLGKGIKDGNSGFNNGTLFGWGSGYFNGFRARHEFNNDSIMFDMGQVGKKSPVSVGSAFAFPGIQHDLICTYNGKIISLYLDGKFIAQKEYTGGISKVDAPLHIGFSGYGVGSAKMKDPKLEYWDRVLSEKEILDRYKTLSEKTRQEIEFVNGYFRSSGNVLNLDIPDQELNRLLSNKDIPESFLKNFRFQNWKNKVFHKKYELALPDLCKDIEKFISLKKKGTTDSPLSPEEISQFGELDQALNQGISSGKNVETWTLLKKKLEKSAPYAVDLLAKIDHFNDQMKKRAVQLEKKIEKKRIQTYRTLRKIKEKNDVLYLYLSPSGSDQNDGSREKPYHSLQTAFDRVIKEKRPAIIEMAQGEYRMEKTALLHDPSGRISSVWIKAAPNAKVDLVGLVRLKDPKTVQDPKIIARLPKDAVSSIRVFDLKAKGITDFGSITVRGSVSNKVNPWSDFYCDHQAMQLVRWPNSNEPELKTGEVIPGPKATPMFGDSGLFKYDFDRPDRWMDQNDIWVLGKWRHLWASLTTKVMELNRKKKTIQIAPRDIKDNMPYYFLNVLEELDVSGEFFVDRSEGKIYFYPPEKAEKESIYEFPFFNGPFIEMKNVSDILVEDLSFRGCRANGIEVSKGSNVHFQSCQIAQIGGNGILLLDAQNCGLRDCRIRCIGAGGVRVSGGNRKDLIAGENSIVNSIITDFCRIDRNYAPAVHVSGLGNLVAHCLIYHSPHHAFRLEGSDHYITKNEVHSVVYEFDDQSGIDIWGNASYRGNVIDENFWHHIGSGLHVAGQAGIRLDDAISGVRMNGNVFYRSSGGHFGGVQIHGGKDNVASENLFIQCKFAFSFSPWSENRYKEFVSKGRFADLIKEYRDDRYYKIYPFFVEVDINANLNYILNNRAINCIQFDRNGKQNVFIGNRIEKNQSPISVNDHGVPTPQALRIWIEKETGHPLNGIGLFPSKTFPKGQETIDHLVSPHYFLE